MSFHRPMAASLLRSLSFPIHWEILRCWGPLLFFGGLAQLARAPALQAGGQRFESVILHHAARGALRVPPRGHAPRARQAIFDMMRQAKMR